MKLGIGHLEVHFGPMFSGKSSSLRSRLIHHQGKGMNVLYINHRSDTRGKEAIFSTHTSDKNLPETIKAISSSDLSVENIEEYDVIGVDEAQFFPDLVTPILHWVNDLHKVVIIAGLDLTAELERWKDIHLRNGCLKVGDIIDLVPYAEIVQKHFADCEECLEEHGYIVPAHLTKRVIHSDTVTIGGRGLYRPCCRFHHSV